MRSLENLLSQYDYSLAPELVAQAPAHPRDSARLLVYDRKTGKVRLDIFSNLSEYLPKNAVLVLNDTKVLPARLTLKKETGGRVKILYLGRDKKRIEVLSDRKLTPGATLSLRGRLSFTVVGQKGGRYFLVPSFGTRRIERVLEKYGEAPIPPYIKHTPLKDRKLREEYQTIFAKRLGSVAAPTASLHFTKRLLRTLRNAGVAMKFVTLHVGLGTFAPLTAEHIAKNKLHKEWYEIDRRTAAYLARAKKERRPVIPVGTTALRTLESAAVSGKLKKLRGSTDLFIREGYRFKFADGVITNFHVPRSSLMMLVAALIGRKKLLELYGLAVRKKFRFFSFGDGMLII